MRVNFIKAIVTKDVSVISTNDRIFEGIATAEMVDKQGEITVRDSLLKQFPIWMKRGGPIMDTHSNRHVGKGLNYAPIEVIDPKTKKKYYGIKITAQIFKDNKLDDEVWKHIVDGTYKGLSFGGANRSDRIPVQQADGSFAYKLDDLELYEMSVCPEPAVPLAVITDFNKIAKSLTPDELGQMDIQERDDNQIIVKCNKVKCYVLTGNPEAHLEKSTTDEIEIENDANVNKAVETTEVLIKDKVSKEYNNMTKEESEKRTEYEDEEEKTSKAEDSKEEVISESEDDKEKSKSIDRLAMLIGKFVDQSQKDKIATEKRFAELEKKLDKALETPAPAEDHAPNSKVKLPNDYVDEKGDEQGSEDPKDNDEEASSDKVQMEEKYEQVTAKRKSDLWTESARGGVQSGAGQKQVNQVLAKARSLGPEGLGELANLINKGEFGSVSQNSFGEGYPEV